MCKYPIRKKKTMQMQRKLDQNYNAKTKQQNKAVKGKPKGSSETHQNDLVRNLQCIKEKGGSQLEPRGITNSF